MGEAKGNNEKQNKRGREGRRRTRIREVRVERVAGEQTGEGEWKGEDKREYRRRGKEGKKGKGKAVKQLDQNQGTHTCGSRLEGNHTRLKTWSLVE